MLRLFVKFGKDTCEIELNPSATLADLENVIEERTGVTTNKQKLLFKGKVLSNEAPLEAAGIGNGARLMLLVTEGKRTTVLTSASKRNRRPNASSLGTRGIGKETNGTGEARHCQSQSTISIATATDHHCSENDRSLVPFVKSRSRGRCCRIKCEAGRR